MRQRLKELLSDSMIYGMSTMLSQFLSLFLVPFYTAALEPADYGELAMIGIVLAFFTPVAGLGLDGALFRYYIMSEEASVKNAYFSLASQLKTAAMLVFCLLFIPFYGVLNTSFFEGLLTPLHFALFLGTFLADNVSVLTAVVLRSERKVKKIATANIATLIVSLGLSIYFVLVLKMHVTGALLAGLGSSIFRAAFYWSDSRKYFRWGHFDRSLIKDLLSYGLPVIPHKIQAQVIQSFTAFIINHKLGLAAAGMYAVATKLAKPISFLVGTVQQSWTPYKFQIHKTDSNPADTFRQLISLYWIGIITLWGIFSILTPYLYHWFINPKYWDGQTYVPFIMTISVAQAFYFTVVTGFELSTKQSKMTPASFISMCVLIGISLLTAAWWAPYSFIVAQAIAYLVMGAVLYPEAQRMIPIKLPFLSTFLFAVFVTSIVILFFWHPNFWTFLLGCTVLICGSIFTMMIIFPNFNIQKYIKFPNFK